MLLGPPHLQNIIKITFRQALIYSSMPAQRHTRIFSDVFQGKTFAKLIMHY